MHQRRSLSVSEALRRYRAATSDGERRSCLDRLLKSLVSEGLRVLSRYTAIPADEREQLAWIAAQRAWEGLEAARCGDPGLRAYGKRVARNAGNDRLRDRRRRGVEVELESEDGEPLEAFGLGVEREIDLGRLRAAVAQVLHGVDAQFPESHRRLLWRILVDEVELEVLVQEELVARGARTAEARLSSSNRARNVVYRRCSRARGALRLRVLRLLREGRPGA